VYQFAANELPTSKKEDSNAKPGSKLIFFA